MISKTTKRGNDKAYCDLDSKDNTTYSEVLSAVTSCWNYIACVYKTSINKRWSHRQQMVTSAKNIPRKSSYKFFSKKYFLMTNICLHGDHSPDIMKFPRMQSVFMALQPKLRHPCHI